MASRGAPTTHLTSRGRPAQFRRPVRSGGGASSSRRRAHLLLHEGPQDQVQRLMIMLQPGSYVRPHHHSQQWEMLVLQQGCGDVLMFDEVGILLDQENSHAVIADLLNGGEDSFDKDG